VNFRIHSQFSLKRGKGDGRTVSKLLKKQDSKGTQRFRREFL
jgi:hypothetical protein